MDCRIFTDPSNGATYDELLESAKLAEQFGYGGFFLSDHYMPFAGGGRPGPTDVWTTLAGLARETSRIRLGSFASSSASALAISSQNTSPMGFPSRPLQNGSTGWLRR